MSYKDPWDDLLHIIGQGWPHYKNAIRPLIGIKPTQNNYKQSPLEENCHMQKNYNRTGLLRLYLFLIIVIMQNSGAS